ncbi:MAG TPA: ABC transporter permease [Thermomicrobiales bacterium]|jgi:ABC-type transport system involved in multi-copper enzyme maturation permease subunit|nr:ABC transporter permease [Thermomicrobiales bacterium]
MIGSISAELFLLRKRAATWILLGIWTALAAFFAYILPYVSYRNETNTPDRFREDLVDLLPQSIVANVLGGFPFFGGVLVLILGALTLGSEYGWGTLKTLFTQRPVRLNVFAAKLVALGIWLIPFVVLSFAVGAIASYLIARAEDASVDWPSAWLIVRGLAAAWLIMAVWAALGVLLGVLSRGTALAIGIGIIYGLVIEGLISALLDQVDVLSSLIKALLRANAYSLIAVLGTSTSDISGNGPGSFSGPFVGGVQSVLVLALYLAAFVAIAATVLQRRDVS